MNLLIVDDDDTLRDLLARELSRAGHCVRLAANGAEALTQIADAEPDVVLLDLMLPDQPGVEVLRRVRAERPAVEVIVLTAHGTVDTALAAMKLGAYDYLQKPCHLHDLELAVDRAYERRRLAEENARLRDGLGGTGLETSLVGHGSAFDELQRFISKVASSDSTVLVRGETGTGKELVARAIHRQSRRRDQPFVVVDCAALQESLLQSELFGHEKGAFTGATKLKYGLFEVAEGGTVFLDEVGDVSPAVQAALLRVLETSVFRRVGGVRELNVDLRLVAATNRDLERMMADGQFRKDLFFRLNAIHLVIKPLRERQEEIPYLVNHFVARHNGRHGTDKGVTPEAMSALCSYGWPGNVRELRNVVEQALVLADGEMLLLTDLPVELRAAMEPVRSTRGTGLGTASDGLPIACLPLVELEKRHIARVLDKVNGHRARAAALLGISQRSLYRKIREYHLEVAGVEDEEGGSSEEEESESSDREEK